MIANKKHQHWAQIFERFQQSGLTVALFCQQNQLTVSSFYPWQVPVRDAPLSPRIAVYSVRYRTIMNNHGKVGYPSE